MNNKLKVINCFFVLILLFLILNSAFLVPVRAHVLKTDGSIGAVMHIDPDDDPIAGQQASFFFEFKDKVNKFTPTNCDCNLVILRLGQPIYSQPLFQNNSDPSLTQASVFFTFPAKDVYLVKVMGKPLQLGDFQEFTLNYDVRVDREADQIQPQSQPTNNANWLQTHLSVAILLGFVAIAAIYALFKQLTRKA